MEVICHIVRTTTLIILATFSLLVSCSINRKEHIQLITFKWNAQKSNVQVCNDCEPNSIDCCEIKFKGERYIKTTSYKFSKKGEIILIYSYHVPLGVNIYTPKEFIELGMISDLNLLKQKTIWNCKTQEIIDNGVVIDNFEIDEKEKRLYVKLGDRLAVYEYE